MSISELLDRTFHLFRNNFFLFAGIAGLAPALALVTQLLGIAAGLPFDYESGYKAGRTGNVSLILLLLSLEAVALIIIYFVGAQLSYGATVYGVSMVHMGKQTTVGAAFKTIRPFAGRLLGISFLVGIRMAGIGILIGISFVLGWLALLAVPLLVWWAIHLYVRYSLAGAACILENTGANHSLLRSRSLTENATGRIWLVFLLTGVLNVGLGYALGIPAQLLKMMHQASLTVAVSAQLGQFLAQTFAAPIATISLVLMYYDQRIRKEAFDLQVMMQALEQAGTAQSTTAAAPL